MQLLRVVDSPQKISRRFKAEFPTVPTPKKVLIFDPPQKIRDQIKTEAGGQIYFKLNWIFAKSEKKV